MKTEYGGGDNPGGGPGCDLLPQESFRLILSGMWGQALGGGGIPAGMPGCFESDSGGVAALDHRLHAGMPPAFLWGSPCHSTFDPHHLEGRSGRVIRATD